MKESLEKELSLGDVLKSKSYNKFLKMSLRNANRFVVDAARYFKAEIELAEDWKTHIKDEYQDSNAMLGVPCGVGFSNVFVHYPKMSLKVYQRYVTHLRTSPKETKHYRHVDEKSEAVAFFKGAIPQRYYSINSILPHKTMNFNLEANHWTGFVSVGQGKNLFCLKVDCNKNHCRYVSYPDIFTRVVKMEEPEEGLVNLQPIVEEEEEGEDSNYETDEEKIPTAKVKIVVEEPVIKKSVKKKKLNYFYATPKKLKWLMHVDVELDVQKVVYGLAQGVKMVPYVNVAQFVVK